MEGIEGRWFWENMTRRLGNGNDTDFWEGNWMGGMSLKARFPRLFHLSTNQLAKVSEMGSWTQEGWVWQLEWRPELHDTELAGVADLEQIIQQVPLTEGRADWWEWRGSAGGKFSVKNTYEKLAIRRRHGVQRERRLQWPSKVWDAAAPFKAQVTGWRLLQNRLPTIDNLSKRFDLPTEERICCCCRMEEESSCHLFLACLEVQKLWQNMVKWCGVRWAAPATLGDHFDQFIDLFGGGKSRIILSGLWLCIVWVWWKW